MTRLSFSSPVARLHYHLLMALFRLSVTRGLYGRFARGLARLFPADDAVWLHEGAAPPFRIALDDGYWTRFALYRGPYEPEVATVLRAAAGATPLFCDLGANKGYWTTRAVPLFDRVIAVEASAQTFAALRENAAHLPNVALHRAAIHARSGGVLRFVNTHLSHASARLMDGGPARPGEALGPRAAPAHGAGYRADGVTERLLLHRCRSRRGPPFRARLECACRRFLAAAGAGSATNRGCGRVRR